MSLQNVIVIETCIVKIENLDMALSIVNHHICHSKLDNLIEYLYFTKAVTVSVRDTKTGLTYPMTQELLPGQKPGRKGKVHHVST